jgi:hypothetical protein
MELVRRYVKEHGYRVERNEDDIISFHYQLNLVHVCTMERDPNFVAISVPGVEWVTEETRVTVETRCVEMTAECKLLKAFINGDVVELNVEFLFMNEDDFDFLMKRALYILAIGRGQYRRRMCGV